MECPECGNPLHIADSNYVSELGSTEVHVELTLVCVNPRCSTYAGPDLNKPKKVAKKVKNKVN
jgi:hypothetical protein